MLKDYLASELETRKKNISKGLNELIVKEKQDFDKRMKTIIESQGLKYDEIMPKGTDIDKTKIKEAAKTTPEAIVAQKEANKMLDGLLADINAFLNKAKDSIKGKPGSPAIRQFLKEVRTKLKNMTKNIKESALKEKADVIMGKLIKLEEAAPVGSLEALRDDIRSALESVTAFSNATTGESYTPYIRYTFVDKIIVDADDKFYQIPYTKSEEGITFGEPKEVTEVYVTKESQTSLELKEARGKGQGVGGTKQGDGGAGTCKCPSCGNTQAHTKGTPCTEIACTECGTAMTGVTAAKTTESIDNDLDNIGSFISLKEATIDKVKRSVRVVLIEAGTNPLKRRHYPVHTIEEAAPLFKGIKMYLNHATKQDELSRPEGDVKNWASTIQESWHEEGKAMADVHIHDNWLWESMQDPVFRGNIGLSINSKGMGYIGKIDSVDMQIIEKIVAPKSVDWVTEAGARGRVVQLLESRKEDIAMLDTLNMQELKDARPDLVAAIIKENGGNTDEKVDKATVETQIKESKEEVTKLQNDLKLRDQRDAVTAQLKESKLPVAAQARVSAKYKDTLIEKELKEAVEADIKAEISYLGQFDTTGKIKGLGEGKEEITMKESVGGELNNRAGIEVPEKKKEETDSDK